MAEITISLDTDQMNELQRLADQFGLSIEEMARTGLVDLLNQPAEEVGAILDYVLEKNDELYRRLAR